MQTLIPILHQLHQAEGTSLFRYLSHSPPYSSAQNAPHLNAVKKMSLDADARVRALEDLLESLGESPAPLNFPTHFASLHFMTIEYLLPRLRIDKRRLVDVYTLALQNLPILPWRDTVIEPGLAAHQADLATLETK